MKIRFPMIGIFCVVLGLAHGSVAQKLTPDQQKQLNVLSLEFSKQGKEIGLNIQSKMDELTQELKLEGRLENSEKATESSKRVGVILKDLSGLYGDFIKTKVKFVITAKNILTTEQKMQLISQLRPQESAPFKTMDYMQADVFDLPLNLSIEQHKKLVVFKADLQIKEIELDRDVELTLLDLQSALFSGEASPKTVDPLIMNLADLAAKEIDNRVNYFLEAKEVLTLDQKRLLIYMLGLN